MILDREQLDAFHREGFLVIPGFFPPQVVERVRRGFERLRRTARKLGATTDHRGSRFIVERVGGAAPRSDVRIHRVVWCGGAEPELGRVGRDPALLRLAAQILDTPTLQQLINQAHFKLPGDGVRFPWHQDSRHRRQGTPEWRDVNGRGSFVQTVMAVDDVTPENGPLEFLAGSCGLGHVDLGESSTERLVAALGDRFPRAVPLPRAGDLVAFGPFTLHRSLENRSNQPRRVLINGFAYPGANRRHYPGAGLGPLLEVPAPSAC